MDFKDLFGAKLQAQRESETSASLAKQNAAHAQTELVQELRPKLQGLIVEVFSALSSAGLRPVDVLGAPGVKAFALGMIAQRVRRGPLDAAIAIDSQGRIALRHEISARDDRPAGPVVVLGCGPLDGGFDDLLRRAFRGDKPEWEGIHLSSGGEIMISRSFGYDPVVFRSSPLAEHLAELGVEALTKK